MIRPAVGQITRAVVRPTSGRLVSLPPLATQIMRSNWITQYSDSPGRPYRWEPTPQHWRELEDRLQRWGGVSNWKRLEQLGQMVKLSQNINQ